MSRLLAALAVGMLCAGCGSVGYYTQSITGHLSLMSRRVPIEAVIDDPGTPPRLRQRLELARRIRAFAVEELKLPDNGSYTAYAEVEGTFVLWNVVATPEFSLQPLTWCYPIVGCLAYRGYYRREAAETVARGLRQSGRDVLVGGVRAYSTLGWFDDPVLSTMLDDSEIHLAEVIFHELAHQVVYVAGDTTFNESFAVAVEREGVRRWLATNGGAHRLPEYARTLGESRRFIGLAMRIRSELAELYEHGPVDDGTRRRLKTGILELARVRAHEMQMSPRHLAWFRQDLNNAHFALIATYHQYVPHFARMLRAEPDWTRVYDRVDALARLPPADRIASLRSLPSGSPE